MEKRTLQFKTLANMAAFARELSGGYLMNTIKLTLTGFFSRNEVFSALTAYQASLIETSDKVFSYQ